MSVRCVEVAAKMLENVFLACLLGFLFFVALLDYRKGEIPLLLVAAGFLCFTGMRLILGNLTIPEMALGLIPGAFLLLLSVLTKQAVGLGDGAVLLCVGVFFGWLATVILFGISIFSAAIGSILIMITKKKKRKETMPFLPFLYFGYLCFLAFY